MSENLKFGSGGEKNVSIFLLKQFYGTFNSVYGWSNRFWQRQMLMRSVTLFEMQEKLSEAVFTDSHPWAHAVIHCPSWCATRRGRFSLSEKKMKSDSCFIAWMCQDICLSSAEPPGEYFGCCLLFFFFPHQPQPAPLLYFSFLFAQTWINIILERERERL